MAVRIISAVVAIPLLLFFIIIGGLPLRAAVIVLSLIGMYELYKAVSGKIKPVHFIGFALELSYGILCLTDLDNNILVYTSLLIIFAVLLIMVTLVFGHNTNNIHDGAITLFGFFYIGVMLSLIIYIRNVDIIYAWLPFIFAFGSDTGAYFVGSAIGKHKLAPVLSPKKSVEGSVGGVVTVAVLTLIYFIVCKNIYGNITNNQIILFTVIGIFGAVFSQIGDLAASSVKRFTGIKDYGFIMPGHGGVLDRFDSVLFTIPVVFYAVIFF